MSDDVISRQAAIDALDEYIEEYSFDLDENGYHNQKWCAMQEAKMTIENMPSAQPEKRTEKRTETHACDLIDRQAAIDAMMTILDKPNHVEFLYTDEICKVLNELPSAQPEIIRCKDCKWFDACVNGNVFKILDVEDYCSYGEKKDGQ